MKFFKLIHLLLIICSALIFLIGVWAFLLAGNIFLGAVSFYGVVSCLYFGLMVLLPEEQLSRLRFLFDKQSGEKIRLKTYEQLIQENKNLTAEIIEVTKWHTEANNLAAQLILAQAQQEDARLILDRIKIKPLCQISHN